MDQITPELQRRRAPTLVTQVMPQSTLVRSAFFNEFIGRAGLYWGLNIHAFPIAEHLTDLRIWRARHRGNFEDADLDLLRLISTGARIRLYMFGSCAVSTASSRRTG